LKCSKGFGRLAPRRALLPAATRRLRHSVGSYVMIRRGKLPRPAGFKRNPGRLVDRVGVGVADADPGSATPATAGADPVRANPTEEHHGKQCRVLKSQDKRVTLREPAA
jgi:hypothetical protein